MEVKALKTLRLIPKPTLKKFDELNEAICDTKTSEFYLYKEGLYIIGETEAEAWAFLIDPILSDMLEYFDYEIVDVNHVKDSLEKNEWDVIKMTELPPFFYFDLLYEVP